MRRLKIELQALMQSRADFDRKVRQKLAASKCLQRHGPYDVPA